MDVTIIVKRFPTEYCTRIMQKYAINQSKHKVHLFQDDILKVLLEFE